MRVFVRKAENNKRSFFFWDDIYSRLNKPESGESAGHWIGPGLPV